MLSSLDLATPESVHAAQKARRRALTTLGAAGASLLLVTGIGVTAHAQGLDTERAPAQPAVAHRAPVPPTTLLDRRTTTVLDQPLAYPTTGQAEVSSSIITLRPGQRTGLHRHDAPMYAYVLSGAVTVSYATGETKTFTKGQALLEAVGVAHEGANLGRTDCRLLVVNMGAEGTANSVKL